MEGLRPKADLCAQYGLPDTFFHLPNQFWAHKNHLLVVDALSSLQSSGIQTTVVCTGHTTDIRRPEYFDEFMARF